VAHYSRVYKIVIDVPGGEHDRELAFWDAATGSPLGRFDRHPEYHGTELPGSDLWLLVQRLDDGPGRVHLDIHTDDLDAEVARLEKLGAERVQQVHGWWVMRDPAGLLFCVLPSRPGSLDGTNAQRWDD
jgi:Glyoxalase-like domain